MRVSIRVAAESVRGAALWARLVTYELAIVAQ